MNLVDDYKNKFIGLLDESNKKDLSNYYFHVCNINIIDSVLKYGILSLKLQRRNKLIKKFTHGRRNNGIDYISLATTKERGNDIRNNSSFDEYAKKDISFVIENLNVVKTIPLDYDNNLIERFKLIKNTHYSIYYDEVHAKDKIDLNNIVGIMVPINKDSSGNVISEQLNKLFVVMDKFKKLNKEFFVINTDGIILDKDKLENLKRR